MSREYFQGSGIGIRPVAEATLVLSEDSGVSTYIVGTPPLNLPYFRIFVFGSLLSYEFNASIQTAAVFGSIGGDG